MISAELATRVAEAFDAGLPSYAEHFHQLPAEYRAKILAVAEAVVKAERAKHKADLRALAACVDDALRGCG